MELQKHSRFQWVMGLVLALGLSSGASSYAQNSCDGIFFVPNAKAMNFKNPSDQREVLNVKGRILLNGKEVARSFNEALKREDVREEIAAKKNIPHRVLLEAMIPASEGGGRLRLVSLDISGGNLAYNHLDLIALLKVNPLLANALGMYRVEGSDNLAWVPDVTQMNYRLKKLAQARGFAEPVFSYETVDGVIDTLPYLNLLAKGKFPFSKDNDVNLSVHDSMHAVAFSALNGTPNSRKVMEAAKTRNFIVLNIYQRMQTELGPNGSMLAQRFIQSEDVKNISPDSLERTMLLSFLLAGNYHYFSAYNATTQGKFTSKQNMHLTQKRVLELLKLYNYGNTSFKKTLAMMQEGQDAQTQQKMAEIFEQELKHLKAATETEMQQASAELLDFFSMRIFSSSVAKTGDVSPDQYVNAAAAGEN